MTAAVRIGLTYFVLRPVQRWLLAFGAVCCGVGLMTYLAYSTRPPLFAPGLLLMHLPAAVLAGTTFRDLSARKTSGLTPRFRPTLLASLLFVAACIAVTWHLSAPLWLRAGAASVPPGATLIVPFGIVSLIVLQAVIASGSQGALSAVFAADGVLLLWLTAGAAGQLRSAGVDPILLTAVASAGAWAAFAAWYLSAPRIGRAWRSTAVRPRPASPAADAAPVTVPSAVASYLTGMPAAAAASWAVDRFPVARAGLRGPLVFAPLVFGAGWLLPRLLPAWFGTPGQLSRLLAIWTGILVLQTSVQAAHETRRARLLWLTHGSREAIFRVCEGRALRRGAFLAAWYMCLVGGFFQVLGPAGVAWAAAVIGASTCAGAYVGLMTIRGWRPLDVVLGGALLLATYAAPPVALADYERAPLVPAGLLAFLVGGALVCRAIAGRRWRRIDWLALRPLRRLAGFRYGR